MDTHTHRPITHRPENPQCGAIAPWAVSFPNLEVVLSFNKTKTNKQNKQKKKKEKKERKQTNKRTNRNKNKKNYLQCDSGFVCCQTVGLCLTVARLPGIESAAKMADNGATS